jgi:sugar lactone lactonase YvrE
MKFIIKLFIAALLAGVLAQGVYAEEPEYTFVTKWGSQGTGDGQFKYPYGVAVDASGNVYVADTLNYRIQKFNSDGTFLTKWGSNGTGDGQFNMPYGVAVDSDCNVYVADTDNHRIQKFDSDGTFLTKWGSNGTGDGQFDMPLGVAVDASGNVFVTDFSNRCIQKFDTDGTFLLKWEYEGGDPAGVAVDSAGVVYVADAVNCSIKKFSNGGSFLATFGSQGTGDGQFSFPIGIAVDAEDHVYVADTLNFRIQKFDTDGTFLTKWGSEGTGDGRFLFPMSVAVDLSGMVYVADLDNFRIQKFSPPFPPVADAGGDQTVTVGWPVILDGSNSTDLNDNIISYEWSFSEGGSATGQIIIKTYAVPGIYSVTLTVVDSTDLSGSDTIQVTVAPGEPTPVNPVEATEQLIEEIEALGLPRGTERKIVTKLDEVLKYLEHANAKLAAVSDELEKQDADDLVEKVQMIIDAISSGDFSGWK